VLFTLIFLLCSINNILYADTSEISSLQYVGRFGALIQTYRESVFDVILEESFDENTLPDIVPFKPKKDVEDPIIVQINNELNEYNLEFGDLFIGNFTTNNKNIAAFILIYGTLKPTIRYYHIK
jgi:molybdopterin-guanine dinucleotide biosynthesis protein